MGIRVNKMCAYALTDVVEDDPRLNPGSPVFSYGFDRESSLDSYLRFVKEKEGVSLDAVLVRDLRAKGKRPPSVQDAFQWGTADGGLESVFAMRPVTSTDWYRRDDTIDWVEETYGENQEDRVLELPHGIFPYSGTYMDARTGERLPGDVMDWIRLWTNLDEAHKVDLLSGGGEPLLDEMAERFGMTHQEAERYVAPNVPDDIRWLAEWAEVFTDEKTVLQLRPVVYAWWA